MTALTIPAVANGDNEINSINANFDLVEAALNNLDGGNMNSGSVLNAALAKGKALFTVTLCHNGAAIGTTDIAGLWGFILPTVDGGSVTFKYLRASVYAQAVGTAYGAGSKFEISKNGAASSHDIEIDTLVAGTPLQDAPAAPVSASSGDIITVNYDRVTSGDMTNITLVLYFSLAHVGT